MAGQNGLTMKAERRHELQKNELADYMAKSAERIEPYYPHIGLGIAAVIVLIIGMQAAASWSASSRAAGWTALLTVMTSDDTAAGLTKVSGEFPNTAPGLWAEVLAADQKLDAGTAGLLLNRPQALDDLRAASELYEKVIASAQKNLGADERNLLVQRATLGLGRALESQGKVAEAIAQYGQIALGPYALAAKQRRTALETMTIAGFYDRLRSFNPPNPLSGLPGTPGVGPEFNTDPHAGMKFPPVVPPTEPAATMPALTPAAETTPEATAQPEPTAKPETTAKPEPTAKPETPAATTPALGTPAAETPAVPATPATSPAPETPAETPATPAKP